MNHTPGPWRSGDLFNTVFGPPNGSPSPATIATIFRGNPANARLIAAAPDLLAELKQALRLLQAIEHETGYVTAVTQREWAKLISKTEGAR